MLFTTVYQRASCLTRSPLITDARAVSPPHRAFCVGCCPLYGPQTEQVPVSTEQDVRHQRLSRAASPTPPVGGFVSLKARFAGSAATTNLRTGLACGKPIDCMVYYIIGAVKFTPTVSAVLAMPGRDKGQVII